MSQIMNPSALPSSMEAKLRSIRGRQAMLAVARAMIIAISVLITIMMAAMIADWSLTLFNTGVRILLTTGTLVLAAVALLVTGVRPVMAALGWAQAAATADTEVPQLEERWTTVTSLAGSNNQAMSPTAKAMFRQVVSEAVALGQLVQPRQIARPTFLRPLLLICGGCMLALAGFLALDWPQTSVLLRRFWSPLSDITATRLNSITGDAEIPRGESLNLVTELHGMHRDSAILTVQYESGVTDVFDLKTSPSSGNTFTHPIRIDDSFHYRVRAGDGQTKWHSVTAIDYPALDHARFTITSPDYASRPPYEKNLIPSRVKALQGSRLELLMKPVAELRRLELNLSFTGEGDQPIERTVELTPDAQGWYRFESQLLEDISLSPTLFSSRGLTNQDQHVCRIQVVPDKAPIARVISPTDEMAVAVDDVIDIKFEAHDDFGIATAELVVYDESALDNGDEPQVLSVQEIQLGDQQFQKHVMATTQLDLTQLNLEAGRNISYAIRVTDNRKAQIVPEGNEAWTIDEKPKTSEDRLQQAEAEAGPPPAQTNADSGAERKSPTDDEGDGAPTDEHQQADSPFGNAMQLAEGTVDAERQDDIADNSAENSNQPSGDQSLAADNGPSDSEEDLVSDRTTAAGEGSDDPPDAVSRDGQPTDPDRKDSAIAREEESDGADRRSATLSGQPTPAPSEAVTKGGERHDLDVQANAQSGDAGAQAGKDGSPVSSPPFEIPIAMNPQQSESGQNTETSRRKLTITGRLTAVAASTERRAENMQIRDQVLQIDKMLAQVETALTSVVQREIPDADGTQQFRMLDVQLGDIEDYIAQLREQTKEQQFAFVGLQMVDIGRSHVTPARDRVFAAIRDPGAGNQAVEALQHVVRARELLAALLERYDRVVQERELAESLEDTATMYEVYVEKMQQLMREVRQNNDPLQRKMGIIEVDQQYLDRYAEVLTLRREMLRELGRMLADDPRLLARYLDTIKRRRSSLRDRLTELAGRQDEIAMEVSGWLRVADTHRGDLWRLIVEMRLHAATSLAQDAAELAERIEKQMPLVLEPSETSAARVLQQAQEIAKTARAISFGVNGILQHPGQVESHSSLSAQADRLVHQFRELDAALDQMSFEHDEEEVTAYVNSRLLDSRTVADQAESFAQMAHDLRENQYYGLAEVDQRNVAIATHLLRVEMLDIEADLQNQFQQQTGSGVPAEIVDMARQLHWLMESITLNQAAATFAMTNNALEAAELQQATALDGFSRAEELFDKLRRAVVAALDEYDLPNPNIADLVDPTLDEFLAQLEREPNIEAQLGIPNRPRNLRVIAESMVWQQSGGDMLGSSGEAARQRALDAMKTQQNTKAEQQEPAENLTDEQRKQLEQEKEMQELLVRSLTAMRERADDPATSPQERRRLEQMAQNLQRLLDQVDPQAAAPEQWEQLTQSDQAQEVLRALARGEAIPDQQWNKLLSTLEDGLWQVRGNAPPEEYRKAIEQYQDRIRQLTVPILEGAE